MDLVYLEAHTSIGLMQSHLQQKHVDALLLIYEASHSRSFRKLRGRPALRGCRTLNLNNLTEAISIIVNDKWNTRAWVLQVSSHITRPLIQLNIKRKPLSRAET